MDELFKQFWQAYPRKVGKGSAKKAWAKAIKHTHPDAIIKALNLQVAFNWMEHLSDRTGKLKQFIPHPTTWLNAGRWEDEIDMPPSDHQYTCRVCGLESHLHENGYPGGWCSLSCKRKERYGDVG